MPPSPFDSSAYVDTIFHPSRLVWSVIVVPVVPPSHLRQLPLPSRLVISAALISIGFGYLSALVQLHFAGGAAAGEPLPGKVEVERTYVPKKGEKPTSQLASLLEAKEGAFTGAGTMRPAFTNKSETGWADKIEKLKQEKGQAGVDELLAEREGERLAMLEWIRAGGGQTADSKRAYNRNKFELSAALAQQPITAKFVEKVEEGQTAAPRVLKIKALFAERCVDCHAESGRSNDAKYYSFEDIDKLKQYLEVKETSGGLNLAKLAQTTHVHLLAFSMLYGLTGLTFSFTGWPTWVRCILSPLPLVAQLADIGCWWLARYDPAFAQVIIFTGAVVGASLLAQIVLSLFDMYGLKGKLVVLALLIAGSLGLVWTCYFVVAPYLRHEVEAAAKTQ